MFDSKTRATIILNMTVMHVQYARTNITHDNTLPTLVASLIQDMWLGNTHLTRVFLTKMSWISPTSTKMITRVGPSGQSILKTMTRPTWDSLAPPILTPNSASLLSPKSVTSLYGRSVPIYLWDGVGQQHICDSRVGVILVKLTQFHPPTTNLLTNLK